MVKVSISFCIFLPHILKEIFVFSTFKFFPAYQKDEFIYLNSVISKYDASKIKSVMLRLKCLQNVFGLGTVL